jgi:purine-binding chemotaxis protein CheW
MPPYIKGVMNLRGTVVPVVDLRIRFNVGKAEYDATTIVIVMNIGRRTIGVVVDGVSDVVVLKSADLRPAPEIAGVLRAEYLQGVAILDNRMLIVVDIDGLMSSRDMGLLESASPPGGA